MRAPSAARVREMRPPRFLAPPATRTTLPCRFCSGICLLLILSERRSAARPRPLRGRARPPPTGKQVVGRLRTVGDLGLSALAAGDFPARSCDANGQRLRAASGRLLIDLHFLRSALAGSATRRRPPQAPARAR